MPCPEGTNITDVCRLQAGNNESQPNNEDWEQKTPRSKSEHALVQWI